MRVLQLQGTPPMNEHPVGTVKTLPNVTLPETNELPLKMDGWNTTFLLGRPIFRGELLVSRRVVFIPQKLEKKQRGAEFW